MKLFLCSLLVACFGIAAYADIQDPPGNDYGPTRKLSRGVANVLYGGSEIFYTIEDVNEIHGNAAGWSYGPIKGWWRAVYRFWSGWGEIVTFPYPTYKGSYRPPYKSDIPWINGGYSEFPPELGFETKYPYTRYTNQY
jgi:putative exosortase-associated protein (TIGR04073 family)